MNTPLPVADCLEMVRNTIRDATFANGRDALQETHAALSTLRQRIVMNDQVQSHMREVVEAATKLVTLFNSTAALSTVRLSEEKGLVLLTLDRLEAALQGVQPSQAARAAGNGW